MRISCFFDKQNLHSIIKVRLCSVHYAGQSITVNLHWQDFAFHILFIGTISRQWSDVNYFLLYGALKWATSRENIVSFENLLQHPLPRHFGKLDEIRCSFAFVHRRQLLGQTNMLGCETCHLIVFWSAALWMVSKNEIV